MSTRTSGPVIPASIAAGGLATIGRGLDRNRLLTDDDLDALYLVVADAVRVPRCGQRLNVARRVCRPAAQLVLTRLVGLPRVAPRLPGEVAAVAAQSTIRPGSPAVGTDLDTNDAPAARPGFAFEDARPQAKLPRTWHEMRNTGRNHQRAREHPGDGLTELIPGARDVIGGLLLVPAEWARHDRDRPEPLHVGHAVPPRHHEPQWKAVLRRERLAVDRIGEEDLVAHGLRQAEAPLVVLLDATLHTAIQAGEDGLDGAVERPGFFEQRSQRRACPLGGA